MDRTVELVILVCLLPVAAVCVADPAKTIVPLYAGLVPVGGVLSLPVPLPPPFDSLTSLAGALAIGAIAGHMVLYRVGTIPPLPVAGWLLFAGWGILTLLWAEDLSGGLQDVKVALPLLALLVAVSFLPTEPADLRRLRRAIVGGGAAIGAYAAALIASGAGLPSQGVSERFSLAAEGAGNPNQLAAALVFPLLAALDMVMDPWQDDRPHRERAAGVAGMALITVAIVLSGSRGGVAAAGASFVAALVLYARWRPWSRARVHSVAAVTVASVIVAVTIGLAISALFPGSRAATIVGSDPIRRLMAAETGASGRAEIWTGGLVACRSHCAFGAGIGGFRGAYADAFPFTGAGRNVGVERPAHNVYLEMVVELGVIGLALFALAVAVEWWTARRWRDVVLAPAAAAAIVGILLTNLFEGFLWFKHAWLPFVVLRVIENASTSRSPVAFAPWAEGLVARFPARTPRVPSATR